MSQNVLQWIISFWLYVFDSSSCSVSFNDRSKMLSSVFTSINIKVLYFQPILGFDLLPPPPNGSGWWRRRGDTLKSLLRAFCFFLSLTVRDGPRERKSNFVSEKYFSTKNLKPTFLSVFVHGQWKCHFRSIFVCERETENVS